MMSHYGVRALLGCTLLAWSLPAGRCDDSREEMLWTRDGWPIHVTYYPPTAKGGQVPVVVLLTAANGDPEDPVTRKVWSDLATHLQNNQFAVIAVDLRKHGDSVPEVGLTVKTRKVRPDDYLAMVFGDMEVVKLFLLQQHEEKVLNIRKLGIVASGASCMVASAFALNDWNRKPWPDAPTPELKTPRGQDVRAIVMISPRMVKGINATKMLRPLSDPAYGIAFKIYHSDKEKAEQRTAEKLFKFVQLKGEEFDDVRSISAYPAAGEQFLIGRVARTVREDILKFLKKNLSDLQSPWRSRKSRLED